MCVACEVVAVAVVVGDGWWVVVVVVVVGGVGVVMMVAGWQASGRLRKPRVGDMCKGKTVHT